MVRHLAIKKFLREEYGVTEQEATRVYHQLKKDHHNPSEFITLDRRVHIDYLRGLGIHGNWDGAKSGTEDRPELRAITYTLDQIAATKQILKKFSGDVEALTKLLTLLK